MDPIAAVVDLTIASILTCLARRKRFEQFLNPIKKFLEGQRFNSIVRAAFENVKRASTDMPANFDISVFKQAELQECLATYIAEPGMSYRRMKKKLETTYTSEGLIPSSVAAELLQYLRQELYQDPSFYQLMLAKDISDLQETIDTLTQTVLGVGEDVHTGLAGVKRQLEAVLDALRHGQLTHTNGEDHFAPQLPTPPDVLCRPAYVMPGQFVGREKELSDIEAWFQNGRNPVLVIAGFGGVGKSALAWHWMQSASKEHAFSGVVWWSFYESGATIEEMALQSLAYLLRQTRDALLKLSPLERVETLFNALNHSRCLLVLDGLERALVAYAGVDSAYVDDKDLSKKGADARQCIVASDADFLRRLPHLQRSRAVIVTRLVPQVFEPFGTLEQRIEKLELEGWTPRDALRFVSTLNIRSKNTLRLELLLQSVGYHPFLIRGIAGSINNFREAPGDFDRWYAVRGHQLDLTGYSIEDRATPTLRFLFEELDETETTLLAKIAAFSRPIAYDELLGLDPELIAPPLLQKLPDLPITNVNPFGSFETIRLQRQLDQAEDKLNPFARFLQSLQGLHDEEQIDEANLLEEIERIRALLLAQAEKDAAVAEQTRRNRTELESEDRRVRKKRLELFRAHQSVYATTAVYRDARDRFESRLEKLESLGLLDKELRPGTDGQSPFFVFDMHPLARSHSLLRLQKETMHEVYDELAAYLTSRRKFGATVLAADFTALQPHIDFVHIGLLRGQKEHAATYYVTVLSKPLQHMGKNHTIIGLLTKFFDRGYDALPTMETEQGKRVGAHLALLLGRAFQNIGDIEKALSLFRVGLDPDTEDDAFGMSISVSDYAFALLRLNRIYEALNAIEVNAKITPENNRPWYIENKLSLLVRIGDFENARRVAELGLDVQLPDHNPQLWGANFNLRLAELYLVTDQIDAGLKHLNMGAEFAHAVSSEALKELVLLLKGRFAMASKEYEAAADYFERAAAIVRLSDESSALATIWLASAQHAQGKHDRVAELLFYALNDAKMTFPEKARVYLQAALLYERSGDVANAMKWARDAYRIALADGFPYVLRSELDASRQLLERIHDDVEPVPAFESHLHDGRIPFENEILAKFQSDAMNTKAAGAYDHVVVRGRTWFQPATIAIFGLGFKFTPILRSIVEKIVSLSDIELPYAVSSAGQDVTFPENDSKGVPRTPIDEISWTHAEEQILSKFFIICTFSSANDDGEEVIVVTNVRLDRCLSLLRQFDNGNSFRLKDFSTPISLMKKPADAGALKALRHDYLAYHDFVAVRLLPPLEQT